MNTMNWTVFQAVLFFNHLPYLSERVFKIQYHHFAVERAIVSVLFIQIMVNLHSVPCTNSFPAAVSIIIGICLEVTEATVCYRGVLVSMPLGRRELDWVCLL